MPWAAAAAAAAAIGGAAMQSDAASKASGSQTNATNNATEEQRRQFNLSATANQPASQLGAGSIDRLRSLLGLRGVAPTGGFSWNGASYDTEQALRDAITANYVKESNGRDPNNPQVQQSIDQAVRSIVTQQGQGGADGTDALSAPLNRKFTMDDFENDPVTKASFNFGLSEGEKAVQRMFGARGLSRSGAAVKAATRYASDYGTQQAGASRQRFVEDQNNLFNKLSAAAGTGQAATTATATLGANTSTNVGNLLVGEGNARGAASIAQGNAYGGALNTIGNNAMGQFTLDRILSTRQPTTSPTTSSAQSIDV